MNKVLIVDDDPDIGLLLQRFLKRKNFEVESAQNGVNALRIIERKKPDLVLLDYRLPDASGEEVLEKIKEHHPGIKVIMITGYGDIKTAINTIKRGAFDYVTKPIQPDEILMRINDALKDTATEKNPAESARKSSKNNSQKPGTGSKEYIKGESPAAEQVEKLSKLVAPTNMSVVILGETGTGKEYVARHIHNLSKRTGGPFVAVDCGALSENLAGSTLFGHVKGAFTGAVKDKTGCFELAEGGTLFLDEVGNLSYENQVKLLRVIEERQIVKLGGSKSVNIDVRILVATNDDLSRAVQKGEFREDLYHRLNEFKIELTPLRKRPEDLKLFLNRFITQSNNDLDKNIKGVTQSALKALLQYPWHGNLRELKNTVKRSVLLEESDQLTIDSLPEELVMQQPENSRAHPDTDSPQTLKEAVARAEKNAILKAFKAAQGNKSKAAEILKVDRKTLYNKLERHNIKI